jgi:hypothetical protein
MKQYLPGVLVLLATGSCKAPQAGPDATGGKGGSSGGVAGTVAMGGSGGGSVGGMAGQASVGSGGAASGGGAGGLPMDAGGDGPPGFPDAGAATNTACEGVDGGSVASSPYADLDITASGFVEHEGQTVFVVTRSNLGGVLGSGSAKVAGGAFAIHFPKGYRRSYDQEILWLLDADGDGLCDADAGDHTGYVLVKATDPVGAEPLRIAIDDNHVRTSASNAEFCRAGTPLGDMLDMNITGVGFDAYEGRTLHLVTRTTYNGAIFGSGEAIVTGGGFAFHFRRGYQRFTYQEVLFFVDIDADGGCAPESDHAGFFATSAFNPIQNVAVNVQLPDTHVVKTGRGADVCVVMNGCQLSP